MNNYHLVKPENNLLNDRMFMNENTRKIKKDNNNCDHSKNNIGYVDNNSAIDRGNNFVNNKETYNQRIFDRNVLNSQLAGTQNIQPSYFSEDYKNNREDSEKMFEKRFNNDIYNYHIHPRVGQVNFSELNRNDARVEFKRDYNKYM